MASNPHSDILPGNGLRQERLAVQHRFEEALVETNTPDIHPLDSSAFIEQLNHEGMASRDIEPPTQDGLYLDSELLDALAVEGRSPTEAAFEVLPLQSIGRENSRNMVFFGNLYLHNPGGEDEAINIAVKPLRGIQNQKAAMHEFAMNEFLASKGIDGPVQIGIMRNGDDIYLLSEFEPHIITLDSLDWPSLDEETKKHAINRGIESLVTLHSNGLFHGDAELKNLTMQPERTSIWIHDMELSVSLRDAPDNLYKPTGIIAKANQDLQSLAQSLRAYGVIPSRLSSLESFQYDMKLVIRPYCELIMKSQEDTPFIRQLKSHLRVIEELFYRAAMGEDVNVARVVQSMADVAVTG